MLVRYKEQVCSNIILVQRQSNNQGSIGKDIERKQYNPPTGNLKKESESSRERVSNGQLLFMPFYVIFLDFN